jgi:hypothetical protein
MIVGLFLLILAQQDSISVHSARPLADAAQQPETKYGVPVFYEDPTWTPAQFPNLGGRPPVFRTYDFAFGFDPSQPSWRCCRRCWCKPGRRGFRATSKL